jgi:hypothetical protein
MKLVVGRDGHGDVVGAERRSEPFVGIPHCRKVFRSHHGHRLAHGKLVHRRGDCLSVPHALHVQRADDRVATRPGLHQTRRV